MGGEATAAEGKHRATAAPIVAALRQESSSREADWQAEREVAGTRLASQHAVPTGRRSAAPMTAEVANSEAAAAAARWEVAEGAVAAAGGVTGKSEDPLEAAEVAVGGCVAGLAVEATLRTAGSATEAKPKAEAAL